MTFILLPSHAEVRKEKRLLPEELRVFAAV